MRNRFDRQLELLNSELTQMGCLIEQAIEIAVNALVHQDVEKANQAIKFDDEIDRQERDIESLCMKLLLQQQPVAKDLRLISAALKMITDMERIGDHAQDISEITILLAGKPYFNNLKYIQDMAKETIVMVVNSIEAFVQSNIDIAEEVIAHDDIVDDLFIKLKEEIIHVIGSHPEHAEQATDLLMIGKYFERIGDHATNIAEWVIFSINGIHEDKN